MPASRGCYGGRTGSETTDYYAILGLDRGASKDSVRLAYRRLARENHPDLVQHLGADASERAASLMRAINEAYHVLSDTRLRRDYDAGMLSSGLLRPEPAVDDLVMAPAAAPARSRMRPGTEVLSSVVEGFSRQMHDGLLARAVPGKWSDLQLEGFDWSTVASFWTAQYLVASRGFAVADVEAATKFTNYCNLAMSSAKHPLKQHYFLFCLAFQKAIDAGSISMVLWRFCANTQKQRAPGAVRIAFLDVVRAKSIVCGAPLADERYQQVLDTLGLARAAQR